MVFLPIKVVGAESKFSCGTIECDPFEANLKDHASLQNGKNWRLTIAWVVTPLNIRVGRVADDIGVPHQMMMNNMMFADQKIEILWKSRCLQTHQKIGLEQFHPI